MAVTDEPWPSSPPAVTAASVSYTHLDVYKRQQMKLLAHHWLRLLCTTRPLLEEASMTVPPPAAIPTWPLTTTISPAWMSLKFVIFVYRPTSVSYTHLDVYKRQGIPCFWTTTALTRQRKPPASHPQKANATDSPTPSPILFLHTVLPSSVFKKYYLFRA